MWFTFPSLIYTEGGLSSMCQVMEEFSKEEAAKKYVRDFLATKENA